MKKIYMTPALTVVRVNTESIVASSPAGSRVYDKQADSGSAGFVKRDYRNSVEWDSWE